MWRISINPAINMFTIRALGVCTPIILIPILSRLWTIEEISYFIYLNSLLSLFIFLLSLSYHSAFRKNLINDRSIWFKDWVLLASLALFFGLFMLLFGFGLTGLAQDYLNIPVKAYFFLLLAALVTSCYSLIETYFIATERHLAYFILAITFIFCVPTMTLLMAYAGAGGDARLQSLMLYGTIFAAFGVLVFRRPSLTICNLRILSKSQINWVVQNFKGGLSLAPLVLLEVISLSVDKVYVRNAFSEDTFNKYMILAQYALLVHLVAQSILYVFQVNTYRVAPIPTKVLFLIIIPLLIFTALMYIFRVNLLDFYLDFNGAIDEFLLFLLLLYHFQRGISNLLFVRAFVFNKQMKISFTLYPLYLACYGYIFISCSSLYNLMFALNFLTAAQILVSIFIIRAKIE